MAGAVLWAGTVFWVGAVLWAGGAFPVDGPWDGGTGLLGGLTPPRGVPTAVAGALCTGAELPPGGSCADGADGEASGRRSTDAELSLVGWAVGAAADPGTLVVVTTAGVGTRGVVERGSTVRSAGRIRGFAVGRRAGAGLAVRPFEGSAEWAAS